MGGGTLLEQLTVRITLDMSGLRRGVAEAIAEIRTLKGAIASQVGGTGLQDAMTAALVAPVALATARIGQMRNEVRALTSEMRNVAAIGFGGGAARGSGAGALIIPTGGGPIIDAARATGADGRPVARRVSGGRMARAYDAGGSDDLLDAATGAALGAGAAGGARRRRGIFGGIGDWFGRESQRTGGAFASGRDGFPGMGDATDNLGMGAHRLGSNMRGAAGSRLAQALGLAGLGSVLASLVSVATSLATVIGGTLAGAFAALMTPLGAAIALFTALAAIFVAANWDSFREFGEWFAERWRDIIGGEGMGDVIAGWNNLKDAFGELWALVKEAFKDDSGSITAVLQFFGELVIRICNAVLEALGGLLNTFAEIIRAIAALIRGDWAAAWGHFGEAVEHAFRAVLDVIASLFPEIQTTVNGIADWVVMRFRDMGQAVADFWASLRGGGAAPGIARGAAINRGGAANDNKPSGARSRGINGKAISGGVTVSGSPFGMLGGITLPAGIKGITDGSAINGADAIALGGGGGKFNDQLRESIRLSDQFGQSIGQALGAWAQGGMRAKDVARQLLIQLVQVVAQTQLLAPLQGLAGKSSSGGFWGSILSGVSSIFGGGGGGFGGFFAEGGFLKPGQWGIVGEAGAEIVRGGRHGMTISPIANDNMKVDARAFIDARGADAAAINRLWSALKQRDAELPSRIASKVGDMRQRGRF